MDHFGGVADTVKMLRSLGYNTPSVHKMLDNNKFERQVLKMYPNLTTLDEDDGEFGDQILVQNIENGDKFRF